MRIAVCIKQVPAREDCSMDPERGTLIREGEMRLNPYDAFALECALRLSGEDGETTAFTMGPESAGSVLKEAFAMGVQQGILVSDAAFAGADVLATSRALSQAIRSHGPFDVIVCGRQTTDGDTGQVGAAIAEYLHLEYLGWVKKVECLENGRIRLEQIRSGRICIMEARPPFVMAVERDIFIPRVPNLKMKLQAGKKKWKKVPLADLEDTDPEHYGLRGSPTRVVRIFKPVREETGKIEEMDGLQGAEAVLAMIKERLGEGR